LDLLDGVVCETNANLGNNKVKTSVTIKAFGDTIILHQGNVYFKHKDKICAVKDGVYCYSGEEFPTVAYTLDISEVITNITLMNNGIYALPDDLRYTLSNGVYAELDTEYVSCQLVSIDTYMRIILLNKDHVMTERHDCDKMYVWFDYGLSYDSHVYPIALCTYRYTERETNEEFNLWIIYDNVLQREIIGYTLMPPARDTYETLYFDAQFRLVGRRKEIVSTDDDDSESDKMYLMPKCLIPQ
jgi:hypothetical protein